MPKEDIILKNKIIDYLKEYKKRERNSNLEFVGPSTISSDISADDSKVFGICNNLRREGIIVQADVKTEYGNYFGYRIKD